MATLTRRVKRLEQELAKARGELATQTHEAKKAAEAAADLLKDAANREMELGRQIRELKADCYRDRSLRVNAQRGFVAYLRKAGMADRIGYDPDQDPEILAGIKEGRYPPTSGQSQILEVARETVATRSAG